MYTLKRALLNYTEKHLNICNYVIPNNIITNDTITIKKNHTNNIISQNKYSYWKPATSNKLAKLK